MSAWARFWLGSALGAALLVAPWLSPAPAFAYCRESIEAQSSGPCVETPGVPLLHWTRGCFTYVFNDRIVELLPLLTEAELRAAFKASYDTWRAVDCGDGDSPFYAEQAPGFTATSESVFEFDVRNESVVSARTREEWEKHDPNALALTLIWHDAETGEILDVDMEFNTGAGRFTDCEKRTCGRDLMDLRNTATHEAGHVLGLGHSGVDGCTMLVDAPDGETSKRSLESDDRLGYCALSLPQYRCANAACECPAPPIYPSERTVETCACAAVGAHAPAPHAWLLALSLLCLQRLTRKRNRVRR